MPTPERQDTPPAPTASAAEVWAPIPRHAGYEASTHGQIRSVDRVVTRSDGVSRSYRGRVLRRLKADPQGYLRVRLAGRREYFVHRLVLEAHVGPAPEGTICCHGNGITNDNRLSNLRWDTYLGNVADAREHGRHAVARTHCPRRHVLQAPNLTACGKAKNRRDCLACARARNRCWQAKRNGGIDVDMQAISDAYYAELMSKHLRENQAA